MSNHTPSIVTQLEKTEEEKKLSIPAKRLMEKLKPIPSQFEVLQYRWLWELVQNACDYNENVDIVVELSDNQLQFKHNGAPFKLTDVENLITPDSDKDDDDNELNKNAIGRYGSGFIVSHALSAIISVQGLMKDNFRDETYYHFSFELDRSDYGNKGKLIDSIIAAEKQLKSDLKPTAYHLGNFDTIFSYDLTKSLASVNGQEIAKKGLNQALQVLPYVMTFLPTLKSLRLNDQTTNTTHYYYHQSDENNICTIGHQKNGNSQPAIKIHYAKDDSAIVAVQVQDQAVVAYPEKMAKLFLFLPMIGTENFPFPAVLHAERFIPTTERDAIDISENDYHNRSGLQKGIAAYQKLLNHLAESKIDHLYHMVRLKSDQIKGISHSNWYTQNIEKDYRALLEEICFIDCHGKFNSYQTLLLPFIPDNKTADRDLEFYDLVSSLIKNSTPERSAYLHWLKNIDFTIFKNIPFRLEDAAKLVQEQGSLTNLSQLINKDKANTTQWLAGFIQYIIKHNSGLLTKYRLIPNQSAEGSFVNRDAPIFVNDQLDKDLITVINQGHL